MGTDSGKNISDTNVYDDHRLQQNDRVNTILIPSGMSAKDSLLQ